MATVRHLPHAMRSSFVPAFLVAAMLAGCVVPTQTVHVLVVNGVEYHPHQLELEQESGWWAVDLVGPGPLTVHFDIEARYGGDGLMPVQVFLLSSEGKAGGVAETFPLRYHAGVTGHSVGLVDSASESPKRLIGNVTSDWSEATLVVVWFGTLPGATVKLGWPIEADATMREDVVEVIVHRSRTHEDSTHIVTPLLSVHERESYHSPAGRATFGIVRYDGTMAPSGDLVVRDSLGERRAPMSTGERHLLVFTSPEAVEVSAPVLRGSMTMVLVGIPAGDSLGRIWAP